MAYVGAEVGVSITTVVPQALSAAEPAGAYKPASPESQAAGAVALVAQYEFTGQILNLPSEAQ